MQFFVKIQYLIFALSISKAFAVPLSLPQDCQEVLKAIEIRAEELGWNPNNFTQISSTGQAPNNFQFIIKGIPGRSGRDHPGYGSDRAKFIYGGGHTLDGQPYNRLLDPERLSEEGIFSSSLITQNKRASFADSGLILEVPTSNIFSANPGDIGVGRTGSYAGDIEHLINVYNNERFGLMSVEELLKESSASKYNEIVNIGRAPNGNAVKPVAYFLMMDSNANSFLEADEYDQLRKAQESTQLPIVQIDGKFHTYRDDKLEILGRKRPSELATLSPGVASFFKNGEHGKKMILSLQSNGIYHRLTQSGTYSAVDEYGVTVTSDELKLGFLIKVREKRRDDPELDKMIKESFPDLN